MQSNALNLAFKPDFSDARLRWRAFWKREIIDRPVISIRAPKDGGKKAPAPPYMAGHDGNFDPVIRQALEWAENVYWGGDAVPCCVPSFGPDMFSAFLGAELKFSPQSASTNWAVPFVEDWNAVLPLRLDPQNVWWQRMQEFCRRLAQATEGKMLISHLDMHSHMDCLSAIRSPGRLCEDFMDIPEVIDRAMLNVRQLFQPIYDGVFEAANMGRRGTLGWIQTYAEGKGNTIQCDFICMMSPAMFRRWVLPAIEEETHTLDHTVYHYDGPGALVHLNDILGLRRLNVVQWVPGAGNPPLIKWPDLLKRIQAAGKGLHIYCSPDEVKLFHKELRPEGVFYDVWAKTEAQARETVEWLVRNT